MIIIHAPLSPLITLPARTAAAGTPLSGRSLR